MINITSKYLFLILTFSFLLSGKLERQIYRSYTDAVVEVLNMVDGESFSYGTGIIVDEKGIIVTNAHVIEKAEEIKIRTKSKEEYKVTGYYAINKVKDYAILQINTKGDKLKILHLGDSNTVKIGDDIIAVGNPLGLTHTLTTGVISSKRMKDNTEMFQIDATISNGSSGGPLFNTQKQVIGIK